MEETEIEITPHEVGSKAPGNEGRRRSGRERKRPSHNNVETPKTLTRKKSSGKASNASKALAKTASFIDNPDGDPERGEKRRKLLDRLNEINAEKEMIAQLKRDKEFVKSLRDQAMKKVDSINDANSGRFSKSQLVPSNESLLQPSTSKTASVDPSPEPIVPEIEFSPDLRRRLSDPEGPASPEPSQMSPSTRAKRQRTPSVLLRTQPGETQIVATPGSRSRQYQFCMRLVKDLLKNKDGLSFSQPVTDLWKAEAIPGYLDIVKQPMDLRTVLRKMESGAYGPNPEKKQEDFDTEMWESDMQLIFSNAMSYNRVGDYIYEAAKNLLVKFKRKLFDMPAKGEMGSPRKGSSKKKKAKSSDKKHHHHHHSKHHQKKKPGQSGETADQENLDKPKKTKSHKAPSKEPAAAVATTEDKTEQTVRDVEKKLEDHKRQRSILRAKQSPSASPRTPTYAIEAQALYHLPMTYEEKRKLGENINKLPVEKLGKLIEIVAKRTGKAEINKDEEIELDIDAMDNKTLREMEAFVNSVIGKKKSSSKKEPTMTLPQVQNEIKRLEALLAQKRLEERANAKAGGLALDLESSSSSSGSGSGSDSSSSSDSESSAGETVESVFQKRKQRELAYRQMSQSAASPFPMSARPYGSPTVASPPNRSFSMRSPARQSSSVSQQVPGPKESRTDPREAKSAESHPTSDAEGVDKESAGERRFGMKGVPNTIDGERLAPAETEASERSNENPQKDETKGKEREGGAVDMDVNRKPVEEQTNKPPESLKKSSDAEVDQAKDDASDEPEPVHARMNGQSQADRSDEDATEKQGAKSTADVPGTDSVQSQVTEVVDSKPAGAATSRDANKTTSEKSTGGSRPNDLEGDAQMEQDTLVSQADVPVERKEKASGEQQEERGTVEGKEPVTIQKLESSPIEGAADSHGQQDDQRNAAEGMLKLFDTGE